MKQIFSADGTRRLRGAWLILVVCLATTAVLVAASHWYLGKERRDAGSSGKRLQEARVRVENIRRERESLVQSEEVFHALLARGLMQSERRLDLVELLNGLRARYQIIAVDYEISPQRALPIAGSRTFPAVDILASRVSLRVRALHEGDVLAFIDSLGESRQGFYPVDRCVLRRLEVGSPDLLQPRVEADCTLEWITMKEKRVA